MHRQRGGDRAGRAAQRLRWGLGLGLLAAAGSAEARTYPVIIQGNNEDDLRNLYEDGLLNPEEFDVLNELLNNPLDINKATRGELYDLPNVTLKMARLIVAERSKRPFQSLNQLADRVEGVSPTLIDEIRPFAYAGGVADAKSGFDADKLSGRIRTRTGMYIAPIDEIEGDHANRTHSIDQLGYGRIPATQLGGEVVYDRTYGVGAMGVLQDGIQGIVYDPDSRDLHASYGMSGDLGRAYGFVEQDRWRMIAGSYTAGFGQGLTFDRTSRSQPNGWYKDLSISADQLFRSFRFARGLFGVAATGTWDMGDNTLESTLFTSVDKYNIYQYDIGMTGGESVDYTLTETDSPRIYIDGQKAGWMTIPDAYRESIVGGNVNYRIGARTQLGLTTYVGHQDRDVIDGMEDDDQFVIRGGWPIQQDTYGAVGINGTWGVGAVDMLAELTKSFTGGWGGQVQAVLNPVGGEIELSLRRYSTDFDNPLAGGMANADEYLGMRDRDEQGGRVRGFYSLGEGLRLQTDVDLWQNMLPGTWNLMTYGRLQYALREKDLTMSVYGKRTDQNLAAGGRGRVYGGDSDNLYVDLVGSAPDEDSEVIDIAEAVDRSGTRSFVGLTMQGNPIKPLNLSALYQRMYTDAGLLYPTEEGPCEYDYQVGQYTWFKARWRVIEPTTLTFRTRYRDEDVHGSLGEHQLDFYLQWDQKFAERFTFATRGLLGMQMADPQSSFKDYCDRQGVPELAGSCVADPVEELVASGADKIFGVWWTSLQMRF